MSVGVFLRVDTGVVLVGDVIITYHCMVRAERKGCQVSEWFVGN